MILRRGWERADQISKNAPILIKAGSGVKTVPVFSYQFISQILCCRAGAAGIGLFAALRFWEEFLEFG